MDFALDANSKVDLVCSSSAAVTVQIIAVFVLPPKLQKQIKIGFVADNAQWTCQTEGEQIYTYLWITYSLRYGLVLTLDTEHED